MGTFTGSFKGFGVTFAQTALVVDATSISITGAVSSGSADLDASAGGITDAGTGSLVVSGNTTLDASADIVLDTATNNFNTVDATAANITLASVGPKMWGTPHWSR